MKQSFSVYPLSLKSRSLGQSSSVLSSKSNAIWLLFKKHFGSQKFFTGIAIQLLLLLLVAEKAAGQGALTNGWTSTGTIAPVGDADVWSFFANAGDHINIRVGKMFQTNSLNLRVRLQNPSTVLIAQANNASVVDLSVTATNTGTFTVTVDDLVGTTATGVYRITLAQSAEAVFVAPGDEGGPLTNGVMQTGTIDLGDLDVWTISANAGDSIQIRAGELVNGSALTPAIWLYGPNGPLLNSAFGAAAAEVSVRATNSGVFTVVVGDFSSGFLGSGSYRLTAVKTGDPVIVSPGDQGGPLTNGFTHTGTIDVGDLDVWTVSANAGDSIQVRMGESVGTGLTPALYLYGPNGALLDSGSGASATEVSVRATNSGTFLVVAGDLSSGYAGSGSYRLTLAKTGDPVFVSPGDEGGTMTNGLMHAGNIDVGDLDVWTITANAGDNITVRMGDTNNTTLSPILYLYGPNGALVASESAGASAAEVSVRATNSGTFLLVAGDFSSGFAGSGPYRLTLAKTGDPVLISPGDEGGLLTNGLMHTGYIDVGDLDVWTISANAGDSIVVRMGDTNNTTLSPALWIYGPNGALLDSNASGAAAAEVIIRATNSGTFLLVAGDFSSGYAGSGPYRLTLAKTGDPVQVSTGDEGGRMTNGLMHTGNIDVGDLDVWYFTANAGDSMIVRMGETVNGSTLSPWLRLYGPNGALLSSIANGATSAEVTARATNSGTFLVVAGDFSSGYAGSGAYRLTLAKTGEPFAVSPGDEGGPMNGGNGYSGTIDVGDIDAFDFTACDGDFVVVQAYEVVTNSTLTPWLRIYGRDGALLGSASAAVATQLSIRATNSGAFTVLVSDNSSGYSGTGAYQLAVNGLTFNMKLCMPVISGNNVSIGGVGGVSNATFVVYTQTNVGAPFDTWTPLFTNQFDAFGVFNRTNLTRTDSQRYYQLYAP